MKREFPIEDEWLSFQLRPQTPPEGIPFTVLFPGVDMTERYANLNKAAAPFGIKFGVRTFVSNSRPALEASEYARDHGKYHAFHERVFRAYFTETLDIGDAAILAKLANEVGLDPVDMKHALERGIYAARLEEAMRLAVQFGVNAVPTFVINETDKIVGAQALEVFRDRLKRIQED